MIYCKNLSYLVVLMVLFINKYFAQCSSNTTTMSCSGGNGVLVNNANVNNGYYYWWSSGTATLNNVSLNGGTITICGGKLTIQNFNFNGGVIIVMGGTLNISNDLNIAGNIVNYGTINVGGNMSIQGNPSYVYNQAGAVINVANQTYVNNNSQLINNGTFNTYDLTLQTNTSPSICQNAGGAVNVSNNFTNNTNNSIAGYGGNSCIYLGNNILLNQNVSNTSNLVVCDAPVGTQSGSGNYGSATYSNNCNCSVVLPIELLYFKGEQNAEKIQLNWATATEINNDYFSILKSLDAYHWYEIARVKGKLFSYQKQEYIIYDEQPAHGINYYKLIQKDIDGTSSESKIIDVYFDSYFKTSDKFKVYPNPASELIYIQQNSNTEFFNYKFSIIDITGRVLISQEETHPLETIDLHHLDNGVYFLKIVDDNFDTYIYKFIVKKYSY